MTIGDGNEANFKKRMREKNGLRKKDGDQESQKRRKVDGVTTAEKRSASDNKQFEGEPTHWVGEIARETGGFGLCPWFVNTSIGRKAGGA